MLGFQLVDVGESTRFACTRRCYDKPLVGRWWRLEKNKSTELPLAADILSSDVDGGDDGGEASQTSRGVWWGEGAGVRRRRRGTSVRAGAGWARVRPVRIQSSGGGGGGCRSRREEGRGRVDKPRGRRPPGIAGNSIRVA